MSACGICGNDKKPLCCGRCASVSILRARVNVIKVTSQLSGLQSNVIQAIDGGTTTHSGASDNTTIAGNEARTVQLHAQIDLLQRKLDKIQNSVVEVHDKTLELRQQHRTTLNNIAKINSSLEIVEKNKKEQYEQLERKRISREAFLEKSYKDMLHLTLGLQTKCCYDLLEIFVLKKKRKKGGYEIVLGFNVVPDLTQLGHYSVTTVNSGLERLSLFTILLASYLGIRLPYEIQLPRKSMPKVLIGPDHEPLWLPHSTKTMMRSSSREFHNYCRLLAMLVINVAHVSLKLGLPIVTDLQDIAKLNQLVAQTYLRVESLLKSGHHLKLYSGSVAVDLESLQDHLITAIDIELNGKSAEWNIIDPP